MYEDYEKTFVVKNRGSITLKINRTENRDYTLVTKTEKVKGVEKATISKLMVKSAIYSMKSLIGLWHDFYTESQREYHKDLLKDTAFLACKDDLLIYEIKFMSSFTK